MKFGAKRDPLLAQLGIFRAKFHSKSLYSVDKKIVGISQYAYFSNLHFCVPKNQESFVAVPTVHPPLCIVSSTCHLLIRYFGECFCEVRLGFKL
jgi:hypothetical protein